MESTEQSTVTDEALELASRGMDKATAQKLEKILRPKEPPPGQWDGTELGKGDVAKTGMPLIDIRNQGNLAKLGLFLAGEDFPYRWEVVVDNKGCQVLVCLKADVELTPLPGKARS